MYKQSRKLLLTSGIALAMAATSGAATATTASQDVTDARQESQIWTTYALSPYLRSNDLKVSVHEGKATLTGKVDESVNKDLAKQIALGVMASRTWTTRSWFSLTTFRRHQPRQTAAMAK